MLFLNDNSDHIQRHLLAWVTHWLKWSHFVLQTVEQSIFQKKNLKAHWKLDLDSVILVLECPNVQQIETEEGKEKKKKKQTHLRALLQFAFVFTDHVPNLHQGCSHVLLLRMLLLYCAEQGFHPHIPIKIVNCCVKRILVDLTSIETTWNALPQTFSKLLHPFILFAYLWYFLDIFWI